VFLEFFLILDSVGTKKRRRQNGERKGTKVVLLGTNAAGSGVGYGTKGLPGGFSF